MVVIPLKTALSLMTVLSSGRLTLPSWRTSASWAAQIGLTSQIRALTGASVRAWLLWLADHAPSGAAGTKPSDP